MMIALGSIAILFFMVGLLLVTMGCVLHAKAHDRFDIVEMFDANLMFWLGIGYLMASAAMAGVPLAHIIG